MQVNKVVVMKSILGTILGVLIFLSALLSIAGIWGAVEGETVGQLLGTFFVLGIAVLCGSRISNSFFDDKNS